MGNLGQYYQDSPEVGKSKVIKEKDELGELLEGLEYNCKSGETNFDSSKGPELDDEEIVSASKPKKSCYKHREGEVKVNDKSDKKVPLEWNIRLTVTEVLDAYYDLDETVEEPFDNAVFGFNEEQKNELEVLLKEVSTECDALVQKLTPKKKEPIKEPGGKINVRNNKDEGVKVEMELGDRKIFEERSVKEWCEDRYGGPLDGDALGHALDEACGWCLRSTKEANSAGKFDPGERKNGECINVTEI
ncbi:889_t:CDS:2, partial [Gigaspora margarita]